METRGKLGATVQHNINSEIIQAECMKQDQLGSLFATLLKRSTTVSMTVLPSEVGRPVTKSKDMWDQGQ